MVTFGAVQGTRWVGRNAGVQVELLEGSEDSLRCSYKYMFQRLRDVRNGKSLPLCMKLMCKNGVPYIPSVKSVSMFTRV